MATRIIEKIVTPLGITLVTKQEYVNHGTIEALGRYHYYVNDKEVTVYFFEQEGDDYKLEIRDFIKERPLT
jgi:hypothetical protein